MYGSSGKVKRFNAKDTVKLPLRQGDDEGTSLIPLDQLVNTVSDLKDGASFNLHPLLVTGDLQTIYLASANYSKSFPVYYGRRVLTFKDGGTTAADFVLPTISKQEFEQLSQENIPADYPKLHPRTRFLSASEISGQTSIDSAPMAIVCHGLGGGSHEPIIRALTETLSKEHGFEVVVLITRGCSRSKLTTPELFCGLATNDIREFVELIRESYPNRPLYGVGFSFGATLLTNYIGEEGTKCPLVAAAVLSNPWDMVDSSYRLKTRFLSNKLFSSTVAGFLTRLLKSNRKALEGDPFFTEDKIKAKYASTAEFDNTFTAPFYGFQTAYDYYRAASSVQRLKNVHIPLLGINSRDDPMIGVDSIPEWEAEKNPHVIIISTNIGGHLAFLQSDGNSWAVRKIGEFFKTHHDVVDVTKKIVTDYKEPHSVFDYKLSSY